jgi:hypothetical protein
MENSFMNQVHRFTLSNVAFDCLPPEQLAKIFNDGRVFSHLIEPWLAEKFPITHVTGNKEYDFIDNSDQNIKSDAKTFTAGGCNFRPSNMIGSRRKFDQTLFEEKANKLIYILVSNINFPEIRVKFISGADLIVQYPKGKIPYADYGKIFEDETFVHEKKNRKKINKQNNTAASTLVNDSI